MCVCFVCCLFFTRGPRPRFLVSWVPPLSLLKSPFFFDEGFLPGSTWTSALVHVHCSRVLLLVLTKRENIPSLPCRCLWDWPKSLISFVQKVLTHRSHFDASMPRPTGQTMAASLSLLGPWDTNHQYLSSANWLTTRQKHVFPALFAYTAYFVCRVGWRPSRGHFAASKLGAFSMDVHVGKGDSCSYRCTDVSESSCSSLHSARLSW